MFNILVAASLIQETDFRFQMVSGFMIHGSLMKSQRVRSLKHRQPSLFPLHPFPKFSKPSSFGFRSHSKALELPAWWKSQSSHPTTSNRLLWRAAELGSIWTVRQLLWLGGQRGAGCLHAQRCAAADESAVVLVCHCHGNVIIVYHCHNV